MTKGFYTLNRFIYLLLLLGQIFTMIARLPPGHTRIQSWYHSKFQVILAIFSPLIPKLCSDKSESGGK